MPVFFKFFLDFSHSRLSFFPVRLCNGCIPHHHVFSPAPDCRSSDLIIPRTRPIASRSPDFVRKTGRLDPCSKRHEIPFAIPVHLIKICPCSHAPVHNSGRIETEFALQGSINWFQTLCITLITWPDTMSDENAFLIHHEDDYDLEPWCRGAYIISSW